MYILIISIFKVEAIFTSPKRMLKYPVELLEYKDMLIFFKL